MDGFGGKMDSGNAGTVVVTSAGAEKEIPVAANTLPVVTEESENMSFAADKGTHTEEGQSCCVMECVTCKHHMSSIRPSSVKVRLQADTRAQEGKCCDLGAFNSQKTLLNADKTDMTQAISGGRCAR